MSDKPKKTWGDVYHAAVMRGEDNGYAAYLADCWEAQQSSRKTLSLSTKPVQPDE